MASQSNSDMIWYFSTTLSFSVSVALLLFMQNTVLLIHCKMDQQSRQDLIFSHFRLTTIKNAYHADREIHKYEAKPICVAVLDLPAKYGKLVMQYA